MNATHLCKSILWSAGSDGCTVYTLHALFSVCPEQCRVNSTPHDRFASCIFHVHELVQNAMNNFDARESFFVVVRLPLLLRLPFVSSCERLLFVFCFLSVWFFSSSLSLSLSLHFHFKLKVRTTKLIYSIYFFLLVHH